jgi:hypothetical protein
MWRQGDVLIAAVEAIPEGASPRKRLVLATGTATGQRHQIRDRRTARLYELGAMLYLEVLADTASIVHPEHQAILLPRGLYRVWRQREHTDWGERAMAD